MTDKVRAHVIISGRVQGVCFRFETQRAAERIGVTGWVHNRADGTVEAILEGTRPVVDEVIAWCQHGPPTARVTNVHVTWETCGEELEGFAIRR